MEFVGWVFGIAFVVFGLFMTYVVGISAWEHWAPVVRSKRQAKSVGASERGAVVDFSGKRARQAAERYAWAQEFLSALGEESPGRVIEGAVLHSGGMEISAQGVRVLPSEAVSDEELGRLMLRTAAAPWRF